MTDEKITEIREYFKRELPETLSLPGARITNVKKFVETQLHRIDHGVPTIANTSFNHLVRLKEVLQSQEQSSGVS